MSRKSLAGMRPMSSPLKVMVPLVGSIRRITMVDVVDLPQPDSPTSPTLSPRFTLNDSPSTALKGALFSSSLRLSSRDNAELETWRGYSFTRFVTVEQGGGLGEGRRRRWRLGRILGQQIRKAMPGLGVARMSRRV